MKYIVKSILFIVSIAVLASCGHENYTTTSDKLEIVCTNFPAYDFSRQIAKDKANIKMLIPPGSESHSFDPKPEDIIAIENADIFVYGGGESDNWAKSIISALKDRPEIISMCDVSKPIADDNHNESEIEIEHSNHHKEHAHEVDEHVWTSPVNAVLICKEIAEHLSSQDKANEEYYQGNLNSYISILNDFDKDLRAISENSNNRLLIFADRFPFKHLAHEYDLSYYAAFPGCAEITEPSAKTVAFLIDKVKEEKIPVIFYVEFSNRKICDTIAEDTFAEPMLLHSCHNITKSEFESGIGYREIMEQNISALRTALITNESVSLQK